MPGVQLPPNAAGFVGHGGSPVKEGSYLQRETSVDDQDDDEQEEQVKKSAGADERGTAHASARPVMIQK